MGVEKYLDVSTGHITYKDSQILIAQHRNFPTRVIPHQYGWWINIPEMKIWEENQVAAKMQTQEYSKDFTNLLLFALENECWWLNLDCDGSYIEELNCFEW